MMPRIRANTKIFRVKLSKYQYKKLAEEAQLQGGDSHENAEQIIREALGDRGGKEARAGMTEN